MDKCRYVPETSLSHGDWKRRRVVGDLGWDCYRTPVANEINSDRSTLMNTADLRAYIRTWMGECHVVKQIIEWSLCHYTAPIQNISLLSKQGAWLANLMFTVLSIERCQVPATCAHVPIFDGVYERITSALDIPDVIYSSKNNVGNALDSLCFLAFEQGKYVFIHSVVRLAADIQWRDKRNSLDLASNGLDNHDTTAATQRNIVDLIQLQCHGAGGDRSQQKQH